MAIELKHPETLVAACGLARRCDQWRGRRADLPDDQLSVPRHGTRGQSVRAEGNGPDLHAHRQSDDWRAGVRLAALEGGAAALAVASGQAASAFVVQNLARVGDNIVSSTDLYGGTYNMFANTLKEQGLEVRFVDPADPENFRRATDDRTRAYYAETLPNPKLTVFPIAEVADMGREIGVPLIVDNTAAPILCRPLDHGAAIMVYSTTKYIGGHGTSIGGAIIDGGNFDWEKFPARQPALNTQTPPTMAPFGSRR